MQTHMHNQKGSFVPENEVMVRQQFDKIILNDRAVPVEDCNHDTIIKIRSRKDIVAAQDEACRATNKSAWRENSHDATGWFCARCGLTIDKISDWKNQNSIAYSL